MIEQLIDSLKSAEPKISVKGKSLFYNVDLHLETRPFQEGLRFVGDGRLRFGPMKSAAHISSEYSMAGDQILLLNHSLKFPGVKFEESYEFDDGVMTFNKNSKTFKVEKSEQYLEPTPFLFKLVDLNPQETNTAEGHLLVGGKLKPFRFSQNMADFELVLNGKQLFVGEAGREEALITIPKFKIRLKVERTS